MTGYMESFAPDRRHIPRLASWGSNGRWKPFDEFFAPGGQAVAAVVHTEVNSDIIKSKVYLYIYIIEYQDNNSPCPMHTIETIILTQTFCLKHFICKSY